MRYYLVAGEASGDLHGSNLMRELQVLDPTAEFRFVGGDLMQARGGQMFAHYKDRAFMGIAEVIRNIGVITKALRNAKKDILAYAPDVLILVDNPGFNMRIARFAKAKGMKVHYYIAPKVWAWNTGRVKHIQRDVDFLYSILPFETAFFSSHGVHVDYVGNPVMDAIAQFSPDEDFLGKHEIVKPVIALLPGSRKSEILQMLPLMASLENDLRDYQLVVCAAPNYSEAFFNEILPNSAMKIVFNDTYNVLQHAKAAIVASGTATLETGLFSVPQVVCYKVSGLTYAIGKRLIKVRFISLVNLILNKAAIPELIQADFNRENVLKHLKKMLENKGTEAVKRDYEALKLLVGGPGASGRAAGLIFSRLPGTLSH